ncbi:unnamed protein product [Strongylus vulgaris]|uniref:Multiprotein bridging factor 1 N-terminal domain-containing protein n=1 Tax=Strongylus vulgaris TaxID=40348 RepID=A0A3P7IWJ1_STRVU|nr:unnamed protein product [Strongylus vulgaris]
MAGGNRQHTANKNTLRLDEETEELHHERVSLSLGKAMQQARQAKEWTQKDLSTVYYHYHGNLDFILNYGASITICHVVIYNPLQCLMIYYEVVMNS